MGKERTRGLVDVAPADQPGFEPAIEPELVICDPHHHLWNNRYFGRYLIDDFLADATAGHRIEKSVFVECDSAYRPDGPEHLRCVGETEFVVSVAEGTPISAMVGAAAMSLGDAVAEVLDAHQAVAGSFLKGIREMSANDPDPGIPNGQIQPAGHLGDPRVRKGIAHLQRRGLSLDTWLYHAQLPDVTEVARAFPELVIVVDHVGMPLNVGAHATRQAEVDALWRKNMTELAAAPNVNMKLGGVGMTMYGTFDGSEIPAGSGLIAERWGERIRFLIDTFSPQRCMFESNFPVDRMGMSYNALWNAFKLISAGYNPTERAALLHDTAVRVYRLD
jgi:L-fuconolactonase